MADVFLRLNMILWLVACSLAQDKDNTGCGSWTAAGTKCIYVADANIKKSWAAARAFCQSMNGDLMKFDNQDDVSWMARQSRISPMAEAGYWIGLNDIGQEGNFVWADGSQARGELLNWNHEPNNRSMSNLPQNCASMGKNGVFIDLTCDTEYAGTVCVDKAPDTSCGTNWLAYNQQCYLFDSSVKTHNNGRIMCQDSSAAGNGRLLSLTSQQEKDWVVQQINNLRPSTDFYWTSLTDEQKEGVFRWGYPDVDDPNTVRSLVTRNTEPNDFEYNEDCVRMEGGFLNDLNCAVFSGFVCQRPLVCEAGWYGENCNSSCGHCKGNVLCNHVSGECRQGCASGWTGHVCNTGAGMH